MVKLVKTSIPGIFRRHAKTCNGEGRCECPYVIVWRHRGRQHKKTCSTFAEARKKKSSREAGDKRPKSTVRFGEYFHDWIESYAGLTNRGFSQHAPNG